MRTASSPPTTPAAIMERPEELKRQEEADLRLQTENRAPFAESVNKERKNWSVKPEQSQCTFRHQWSVFPYELTFYSGSLRGQTQCTCKQIHMKNEMQPQPICAFTQHVLTKSTSALQNNKGNVLQPVSMKLR